MNNSLNDVHQSIDTTTKKVGFKKIFSFLGPAYLISVGYMDPGNWATDLQGGSQFGYQLLWVLLMSNFMALLLQGLSARLGIVRGRDLAQVNRETYPKIVNIALYLLAEVAIAACDLAEVLGMAIGIQLLTGLPLIWGVSITVLDTFLLLYLQRLGMRRMEAFIITLVAIVAICFFIEIVFAHPNLNQVAKGLVPSTLSSQALLISIGIIGATVMPHNLYLHSALVQTRKIDRTDEGIKQALKFNRIDTTIALNIAFLVNAAILILAATVFFNTGNTQVGKIEEAHQLLPKFLGSFAPILFAIALIAAGQSSTITGTLAGQIIMEGYLSLRINPWLRRLITRMLAIIPALLVIIIYGEKDVDKLLLFSQVILSLQLGFAIIPLIYFVSDKKKMGNFAIKPIVKIASWGIAAILLYLNFKLLIEESAPIFKSNILWPKILVGLFSIICLSLLFYILLFPFLKKSIIISNIKMHPLRNSLNSLTIPVYNKIAVALDFSSNDEKLIAHAIGQGNKNSIYYLIHIVESASAKLLGAQSDDDETREDNNSMQKIVSQLQNNGFKVKGMLGYANRTHEIVRLIKEVEADMLIMGAHGHTALKDFVYGETVNTVRHQIQIPVLVVNLKSM